MVIELKYGAVVVHFGLLVIIKTPVAPLSVTAVPCAGAVTKSGAM